MTYLEKARVDAKRAQKEAYEFLARLKERSEEGLTEEEKLERRKRNDERNEILRKSLVPTERALRLLIDI
jgi:hypothetical protein